MPNDWSPGAYDAFRGFRLRPALDLLAQVPERLPQGDVIDLGCGSGAAGSALRARFPGRRLVGVDASPAMLAVARDGGAYDDLAQADVATWRPGSPSDHGDPLANFILGQISRGEPQRGGGRSPPPVAPTAPTSEESALRPAVIFSNAVLHWLPDHGALIPRLARLLAAGGCLAFQMPRQFDAPSHRLIREVAAKLFPDRFDWTGWTAPVAPPEVYMRMLTPLGAAEVWETDYLQRLPASDAGHPVRLFTQSTAVRPVVGKLDAEEEGAFLAAYDAALAEAYPPEPDGTVLMPFLRLFFVLSL